MDGFALIKRLPLASIDITVFTGPPAEVPVSAKNIGKW